MKCAEIRWDAQGAFAEIALRVSDSELAWIYNALVDARRYQEQFLQKPPASGECLAGNASVEHNIASYRALQDQIDPISFQCSASRPAGKPMAIFED